MILSDFQPHGQSFGSHRQPSTVNHHEVFFLLPFFSELSQLTNQLTLLIFFISSHTIQHSPPPTHKQFLKMPEALCLHCWLQGSSLAFQHSLACHLASYSIGNRLYQVCIFFFFQTGMTVLNIFILPSVFSNILVPFVLV